MQVARVGILGYGVIGKRLADAVRAQPDMELAGVAGPPASFSLRDAELLGLPVYVTEGPKPGDAATRFCRVRGSLDDLAGQCDVLLDCTPSGVPVQYLDLGRRHPRLVVIVQGGEKAGSVEGSFNSFANYSAAAGKKRLRVISCSSTGVCRFAYTLDRVFGLRQAFVSLFRRAADPGKRSKNPINALTPVMGESHHAPDVRTVLPELNLYSMSLDCNTTLAHVLNFQADLRPEADAAEVLAALEAMPRVTVGAGLRSTADIAEHYRDLGRPRQDRPEIYVWKEGLRCVGTTVYATISVHMESITIPETVDCVRAALGMEPHNWTSIKRTDEAMGIAKGEACYRR
jgi:glyceraldehyde-3-phosphate dehydrogenase (NAD(P))